jgi:hypothetical protein
MPQIAAEGIPVLVPPDAELRTGERPGWTGGMYSFIRRVLATPAGYDLYRQRQITISRCSGRSSSTAASSASSVAAEPPVAASGG